MLDHLLKIKEEFDARKVEAELGEANDHIPFPHLLVHLKSEINEAEVRLLILSLIGAEVLKGSFPSAEEIDLLSILHPFPFEVDPENLSEVVRLMDLLNKVMVLGAFGYDEHEKRCFFHHTHVLNTAQPVYTDVGALLMVIKDILDIYCSTIEDVAAGVVSVKHLLERFQRNVEDVTS